jgi:hypothetical protein
MSREKELIAAKVSEIIREVRTTSGTLVCFVAKCDNGAIRFGFISRFSTSFLDVYLSMANSSPDMSEESFMYMCMRVACE